MTIGEVRERVGGVLARHRDAIRRTAIGLSLLAAGLLVTGGTIRAIQSVEREPPPLAPSGSPTPEWRASVPTSVRGIAVEDGWLYVSSDLLSVFPLDCVADGDTCLPGWRGVVPDGPISAPTVRDEHVFVGSSTGQLYAFPAACEAQGCAPEWVGVAGEGRVSRPAANFDLVYVTSDELYAFPVACASEDQACLPSWSADVAGEPAEGAPALGGGLVVVASASTHGGVAAYPAVCAAACEPAWTGRTDGPATAVAIGDGLAYTVARGALLAFDLGCSGRCPPVWRAPFLPGAPFARGASSAPVLAGDRVLVGDDEGRLWVFRATCDDERCDPLERYAIGSAPLLTPAVDGERVVVTSTAGELGRVLLDCRPGRACDAVKLRSLGTDAAGAAVFAPDATVAGAADGSLEAFRWFTLPA